MSARCQTCKAPMLWLKNDKTGKPAPIDEESLPADEANILVDLATGTYRVMARLEERTAMGPDQGFHTNHWATCPDREAWKAKRPPIRLSGGA